MQYLDLPKPHGWLIWRGKQIAIASDKPLSVGMKMLLISDNNAYGEATLAQPTALALSEFERLETEHCIRPEERKLYWPGADVFYVHRLVDWQPFEESKSVSINGSNIEFADKVRLTESQKELLQRADRLPKTLVLSDDVIIWEDDKAIIRDGLGNDKIKSILQATLEGAKSDGMQLPLYQLALVRVPRFWYKEKKSEDVMPYKIQNDHPECDDKKPVGIVNTETGKLKGCSEDMDIAKEAMAVMMANEGKSIKELLVEARKCYDEGMPMPMMMHGPVTFAELEAEEEAREIADENYELAYQFSLLSSNILSSEEIKDKSAALLLLATEYGNRVQAIGKKELEEGEKAKGGYLVSGDEGDHLPTTEDGKVSHRLMGAAWAALHGGYRGNKYEGPGKAQAIAKLKKLYESEGMDLPGEKGDDEVPENEKAGKRVRQSMKEKLNALWDTFKEFMDWANEADKEELPGFAKGFAIKNVDGKPWFVSYSTNAFMDREGEIFSTEALERYVTEAEQKGDRGTFNFWHIPNTDFAKKEWQAVVGRILVEAGPFLDNQTGQKALQFFTEYSDGHPDIAPEGWGCSPEYRYLPEERKTAIYKNIWITRTSALPRLAAANIWTKGALTMAYSEQQKQAANKIFGEELAAKIFQSAEDTTKELESAGIAHKSEGEQEVPKPDESAAIGPVLEALAALDIPALNQTIQTLMDSQNQLNTRLDEVTGQIKSLEKAENIKQKTETPRYAWQSWQRASEAQKTTIADDDALKNMKPVEAMPVNDASGAAHFFPAKGR